MNAILATVALEPRRWMMPRYPAMTLHYLLPHIAAAGFDAIEAWQWHVSRLTIEETHLVKEAADALGVSFAYIGVYPQLHLPEGEEAQMARTELFGLIERARILGVTRFKIMLGMRKGAEITPEELARHNQRFAEWYAACDAVGISMVAELHGNTMFDPCECGRQWMAEHPEYAMSICFQPYDFSDTDEALRLADSFAGQISHVHLQGRKENAFSLLEDADIDYARLLPAILEKNPSVTGTIEFVRDCTAPGAFDVTRMLAYASQDREYIAHITAG